MPGQGDILVQGVLSDYVRSESVLCEPSASVKHTATPQEAVIFPPDSEAVVHDSQ